ncbi:MAG: acetylglutamate kinase [Bacilli bacterium]|nr:acetylglutamate kinase [Bacilli bacterium]
MSITNEIRTKVLIQALPYIQKYYNKVVVVKYGGNAMTDEKLKKSVIEDVVLLSLIGMKVVLIHGGGPEISDMLAKLGKKSEFIDGLRVTDKDTVEVVQMILAGKINKDLVNYVQVAGGRAIGLSGIDARIIEAQPINTKLGFAGDIISINPEPISELLNLGYIPVISTVACDKEGNAYNVNADTAAARIAGALNAESFISLTDVIGLLKDKDDPTSLISSVNVSEVKSLVKEGIISGGMIPKVECCCEAIRRGVKKVFIIDGRVPHSILIELLSDEGIGTMFS